MSARRTVPELLAPAGSMDAVRAALGNGADAIYLGAGRFNARDEGAQLSLEELGTACRMAHARQRRIYMTLNTLVKQSELSDALEFLGAAVDRGIDAVIVQDIGLVRLIRMLYPDLEIHGSTQMTVHDESGARLMRDLGVKRVVLARENSLQDISAIRAGAADLGIETFVHGALCISYSGQCFMSGMISERSANRGSCAQSCRKGYTLKDAASGDVLDHGFVISARDLAAAGDIGAIADAGVECLKIEGRKKKAEYVATVTSTYRRVLDRLASGDASALPAEELQPLVQIFSRGFTSGHYHGRDGRDFVTRTQPDNLGAVLGVVVEQRKEGVVVEVSEPIFEGDGLGFDPPGFDAPARGFRVASVRTLSTPGAATVRQLLYAPVHIPVGWRVVRSSQASLLRDAKLSFDHIPESVADGRLRVDAVVSGVAGSPLIITMTSNGHSETAVSDVELQHARGRPIDMAMLREYLGRLGASRLALGGVDISALDEGLFIPVSELNRMRRELTAALEQHLDDDRDHDHRARTVRIRNAVTLPPQLQTDPEPVVPAALVAEVHTIEQAQAASAAGCAEVVLDPFLRHPTPPLSRVLRLRDELEGNGVRFRIRTPVIVRPQDRSPLEKWLNPSFSFVSGHIGLVAELAASGRDVVADYAANVFNQHSAAFLFGRGASGITLSIELTVEEIATLVAPWNGRGFTAVVFGRPEGMTIEHCVLSAAFNRIPTTCRDLCVKKHTDVQLTDPAGYTFPVATDSDCRNRLLHSRPIDGSAFIPALLAAGVRTFKLIFNTAGDPIADVVAAYREVLRCAELGLPTPSPGRNLLNGEYTRGHFSRAV